HLPGQVAALARYRAGLALAPSVARRGALIDEWLRLLDEQHTPTRMAHTGQQLDLGGATLRVLASGNGDENGLMLRLDYGATSVGFDHSGGEAEGGGPAALLRPACPLALSWQRHPHQSFVC